MVRTVTVIGLMLIATAGFSQEGPPPGTESDPLEVIETLYRLVTFGPENPPRWDSVRGLFIEDAVILLRTSKDESTIFSLDGFIDDFKRFAGSEKVVANGFSEKIIRIKKTVFGDIAHFLVLYEASIPGTDFKPQRGVDSFQLVRKDAAWKILSIINEVSLSGSPLPEELTE